MATFGAFVLILILGIPLALLNGWALSVMWGWFIVPLGAPALGLIQAIGITYVVTFFTYKRDKTEEARKSGEKLLVDGLDTIFHRAVVTLGLLGFAYLWHLFL